MSVRIGSGTFALAEGGDYARLRWSLGDEETPWDVPIVRDPRPRPPLEEPAVRTDAHDYDGVPLQWRRP